MPPAHAGWVIAAVTATITAILVRRQPWPAFAVSVLVGVGIGPLLPFALLRPDYRSLDGLAAVVGTALLTASARAHGRRGYVLAKRWSGGVEVISLASWQLVAGGLILTPVAVLSEGHRPLWTHARYLASGT
jgi:probable blue pigment (indigoidine) exporter